MEEDLEKSSEMLRELTTSKMKELVRVFDECVDKHLEYVDAPDFEIRKLVLGVLIDVNTEDMEEFKRMCDELKNSKEEIGEIK